MQVDDSATKNFNILTTNLNVLYNYLRRSKQNYFYLYLAKILAKFLDKFLFQ